MNQKNIFNVKIYFLSGTGNSYRVSTWIENISNKYNIDARIYPVEKIMDATTIEDGNDSLIGIIFPTHGFTAPLQILKFSLKLPRRKQTNAFCIATRAGLKF
ncbi:MAG: hypothetical protein SVZ03_02225 [Spirochaetota bacterium]|nr:hypothetical protein [Spirochaetota bacterium]